MTTTGSPASPAPVGRPRSFDEEEVLDILTGLFWHQGYSRTSVADIVEATGLHKPSLYRTFGSKEEMFTLVLRRFVAQQIAGFTSAIDETPPGLEGIHAFLDLFTPEAMPETTRHDGCLVLAASSELHGTIPGFNDFAQHYRSEIRTMMRVLVQKVDADAEVVDRRADLLTTFFLGHLLLARSGGTSDEISRSLTAMRSTIESW